MKIQNTFSPLNITLKPTSKTQNKSVFNLPTYNFNSTELLSNYSKAQISFKKNIDIFEKMTHYTSASKKDVEKRKELFSELTLTAQNNVKGVVEKFEKEKLDFDTYLLACIKQPSFFSQSPNTTESNVRGLVNKFKDEGLTIEKYLPACIKQPQLFGQSADTIEKNVRGVVDKFTEYGLTIEKYLPACIKQPPLFCLSTNTLESNVKELVDKFKDDGLTIEKYFPACIKQPSLFYQSPDTLESNVKELVDKFKNDGLTIEKYLPACVKQSSLFYRSPDTIEANVRDVVDKFKDEGLTVKNYLPVCVKEPSLFTFLPETVSKHIKAYSFIEKDKEYFSDGKYVAKSIFDIVNNKNLHYSNDSIYSLFLRNKIFGRKKPEELKSKSNIQEKMKNYFKEYPDKTYSIKVINDEMTPDFIDFCKKLSNDAIGKDDMFKISVIKNK